MTATGPPPAVAPAVAPAGDQPVGDRPAGDRPIAVFVGGPPASGKTTLGAALAPVLHAALIDLDVATGPLSALVLDLLGAADLDEPRAARLTRAPRYDTVFGLAEDCVRAGTSVVVVAPFGAERDATAWVGVADRFAPFADVQLVWLVLDAPQLHARMRGRAAARDAVKLRDTRAYLDRFDASPPTAPHLALDAARPVGELVAAVRAYLNV